MATTVPSQRRRLPFLSTVAGNYLSPHPFDPDDEALLSLEEYLDLDSERAPCQHWHEFTDPTSGVRRRTLWPCGNKRLCSRCIDLRAKELTDRFERALANGPLAVSVVSKAEAIRHLRRAGKDASRYLKGPVRRGRVLLVEDAVDAIAGSTIVSTLDDLLSAVSRHAYHSLRTLVRLTPKRRRLSGGLGKEAGTEEREQDEDGGNGSQAKEEDVVVKVITVSLREPNYPDTPLGHRLQDARETKKREAWLAALVRTKDLDPQSPEEAVKACRLRTNAYLSELLCRDIKAHKAAQKVRIAGHLAYTWKKSTQCVLNDARRNAARPDPPKKVVKTPPPTALAA